MRTATQLSTQISRDTSDVGAFRYAKINNPQTRAGHKRIGMRTTLNRYKLCLVNGDVTCRKFRRLTFSGQCIRTLSPNGYGRKLRRYLLMIPYELFQNTFRVSTVK